MIRDTGETYMWNKEKYVLPMASFLIFIRDTHDKSPGHLEQNPFKL